MRTRLATILGSLLFSSLVACGSDGMGTDSGDSGDGGDDAMEPDGGIEPPARGFQIQSPDVDIPPNTEITYCYYFRTSNTEKLAIKKWASNMTPGSHHLIVFLTNNSQGEPVDKMPPGTVSATNCGFGGASASAIPSWTYSAQTPDAELVLPTDDGNGQPVAMEVPANAAGFVQMHYYNATDEAIKAHVTINAEALDAGVAFTKTAAYVTYNASIAIPPQTNNYVVSQSCNINPSFKFWLLSTHAHKQAIKTEVKDGSVVAFSSTDWEHPGAQAWMSSPFFSFASGKITYECTYNNSSNRTIRSGDSAATDEMCMASGYYFPATKPLICYDGLGTF